ncbi:MAG: DUF6044 family protein [Sulfurovum sp.]|nr:DUF6044 family protein [Sulfurovum sp.]
MKHSMHFLEDRRVLWTISLFILTIYFLPYFTKGQNIHAIIYDNLDSSIVWLKILANSGKIFADSMDIIPNMMNGLPRLSYGSEFTVLLWLYYFFDDFTAYVINDIIVHSTAFLGMALLLSNYIINKDLKYYNIIVFSVALLFALVPFWSNGGLSVAAQPLALYAFLNIRAHRDNKWDWIILILLPFYSSLVLAFFFFLFSLGLVFLYDTYRTKQINYRFILAIVLMTSVYLFVEYRLVYNMLFDSGFVSHRTEFDISFLSFNEVYKNSHLLFLNGQDHNINLHYRYILPIILLALFISISKDSLNKYISIFVLLSFTILTMFNLWRPILTEEYSLPIILVFTTLIWLRTQESKLLPFLLIIQIMISYWTGFLVSDIFDKTLYETIPFLHSFHMRFLMLQTLIWYILLGMSIPIIIKKLEYAPFVLLGIFFSQLILTFENRGFTRETFEPMSYKAYYAEDLFQNIDTYLKQPKESYRIVSLGMSPAISLYNGFYTTDGYSVNYPVSYKHSFRKIIEKYLDTFDNHQADKHVIDDWGSKLYLLTGAFVYDQKSNIELDSLTINIEQLKYLGTKYIFSLYKIKNPVHLNLKFLKKFESDDSYWDIYIYEIL